MAKSLGWYLPEQLELKITLSDSKPAIWRRVEVHSGLTLHELHFVIQNVFEWEGSHLYHFLVTADGKFTFKAMRDAQRYHMLPPDAFFEEDNSDLRANEAMLGRMFTAQRKQILYEYDFGDSWQHVVKLMKRTPGGDPAAPPKCLDGANAAPLDDMGGIGGYYQYLEAWSDPDDEMHEQAVEWLGKDFDPGRFDLEEVNWRLAKCFAPAKKRPAKKKKP
jgi:hypothetical protein